LCVFADHGSNKDDVNSDSWKYCNSYTYMNRNDQEPIFLNTPTNNKEISVNSYDAKPPVIDERIHLLTNDDGSDSDLDNFVTEDDDSDEEDWRSANGDDDDFNVVNDINYSIYKSNNNNDNGRLQV
jgi:hypothetical protein